MSVNTWKLSQYHYYGRARFIAFECAAPVQA